MKKYKIILGIVFIIALFAGVFISHLNVYAKDLEGYHKLIIKAYEDSNWKEVHKLSDIVIKNYQDVDFAYMFNGVALHELGYYEDAIKNYTQAIKIEATAAGYQNRGLSYMKTKQYSKALADYNKALQLDPNNKWAKSQREWAINAKKGIVVTKNGNITNTQSINDPFYLAQEYKEMPQVRKQEYINAVKSYSDKVLPIYYMAVAEDIYAKDKNLAAFLYFAGYFRSAQDVLMCKDESAFQAISLLYTVAPDTAVYISKMKPKKRAKLLQDVLDWDEAHPNRPNSKWICYHGMDVFFNNGKVTTYPKSKLEIIKKETRENTVKAIQELK